MTKITPEVWIDSFSLDLFNDRITAFTLIDGKDIDFNINQTDFEIWADSNEMRDYEMNSPSWPEVYNDSIVLKKLIKHYIEFLYEQHRLDINIQKIDTCDLDKSMTTLEKLMEEHFPNKPKP